MGWQARRWGSFPRERLVLLIEQLEAAGHRVTKIVNGKPITDLPDSTLEALATGQISLKSAKPRDRQKSNSTTKKIINKMTRQRRSRKSKK